ncbi:AraC-type DNA-binding protein [Mucilaginibacter lappiensis]|uniref:AraC-like DNA-binding protein n=1 Tax=Mucilaginibacter lappiensis TaxID=354630 RepID=A0ABR6PJR5_9SPHI|nr:helix-turn-helix domain-containing protein [Mucilaginibacter lappiensis]MBB6110014.1 AraC-like DNA-binding protein [Mucilaginibacter lappiensis]SIR55399.1 AraC-type DNA-binding protein [Mucilaginibacter lappiensis]
MANKINRQIPEFGISGSNIKGIALKNLDLNQKAPGEHHTGFAHRDDHYMLVALWEGKLKAIIDFEDHEFSAPCLLMIFPEQVHQLMPQTHLSGWTISFDTALISEETRSILEKDWQNQTPSFSNVPVVWLEQINSLFVAISQLYNKPLITSQNAITALLIGLLYIIIGNIAGVEVKTKNKKSRPTLIKQQFLHLLYKHFKDWKKPSVYAEKLNITTAHLNDTVKRITGRSATEAIQEHCILEARRLLRYTDLGVKEVGYQVGYLNPSHFIKIFKAVTSLTPAQYRQGLI